MLRLDIGIPREPMTWAGNKTEELRQREKEVEYLGDKEEQHRLAEVTKDGDDSKRHSGKITESVTDEHLCRVPSNRVDITSARPQKSKRLGSDILRQDRHHINTATSIWAQVCTLRQGKHNVNTPTKHKH